MRINQAILPITGQCTGQNRMRRPDGIYERGGAYIYPMYETDEKSLPGSIGPSLAASRQPGVDREVSGGAAAPLCATNDNAAAAFAGRLGSPGIGEAACGKLIEISQAATYVKNIKSPSAREEHLYNISRHSSNVSERTKDDQRCQ